MILSTNKFIRNLGKVTLLALVLLMALAACSESASPTPTSSPATVAAQTDPTPEPTAAPRTVMVVTTTNIVADWVENIGGDHVEVFSMVPIGADPHGYQPGTQDVAKIADADLVFSVGLGLEESWLRELVQNAARDSSTIIELAELVDPIEFAEGHAEEVEAIETLMHIVHEVEEGEISPEEGIDDIKEALEGIGEEDHGEEEDAHEGEDHGDEEDPDEDEDHRDEASVDEDEGHGEEDELVTMVLAIVEDVEEGHMEASDAVETIEGLASEGEEAHEGHGHGTDDPHFWFDPLRVKVAVNEIASRLSALDPSRDDLYRSNASAYNTQLDDLHAWTEEQVSVVPQANRLLTTSHDSLGYFANLYGFEVVGVVLSITTEVEPSPEDLVDLIEEAREYEVPAVFGETTVSERLASTVASESGAQLVRLYSGSLDSADTSAGTYIGMIRTNVERIVEALK